nr:MAG TPA: hypothetical protein [Caudoviricetes sp.]
MFSIYRTRHIFLSSLLCRVYRVIYVVRSILCMIHTFLSRL